MQSTTHSKITGSLVSTRRQALKLFAAATVGVAAAPHVLLAKTSSDEATQQNAATIATEGSPPFILSF